MRPDFLRQRFELGGDQGKIIVNERILRDN